MEPAPEGPLVKPKRPMTESQLEALKRGRAKLAEKRRQMKEGDETQSVKDEPNQDTLVKSDSDSDSEASSESEEEEHAYCSVM